MFSIIYNFNILIYPIITKIKDEKNVIITKNKTNVVTTKELKELKMLA